MLLDYIPPTPGVNYIWYPISSPQQTALESPAEMLMYGGGSGGGKTDFLVADACQERDSKNLRALILRRAFTEMANIMDRTRQLYSQMGAYWRGNPHNHWLFPSGAQVRLGYISAEKHVANYQGNPFSVLEVDESTHQREKYIRDILPWLATTDASLRPRVRFATNPGSIGADWHTSLFLRGKCPVHFPEESAKPGAVYRGAKWPSDGEPVLKTVSFVPALLRDNPLYGEQKLNALKSQTKEIREKLLTGCWCALEGRYFSFLTEGHKFPCAKVGEQYWWTRIISIDYGFGDSSAAAGLYAINELGVMFKIAEKIRQRMDSKTFAREVCEEWAARKLQGQPAIVSAAFFDPANDAHTGTGKSNFDIMQEVFEKYDIPCLKSAKDRIGNAQNAYNRLEEGTLVLCDTAPMTHKSFMTRMHDPKTPGDVLKVKGDPLDDFYDETCLPAGTMVLTSNGEQPIESVKAGDFVMTRHGLRPVVWSGSTGEDRQLYTLELTTGGVLTGTGNHPLYVEDKGFTRLDEVMPGDIVLVWEPSKWWSSTELSLDGTQMPEALPPATTTLPASQISDAALICSTARYGSSTAAQSPRATTFITSTKTPRTTASKIWNAFLRKSIPRAILTRFGRGKRDTASTSAESAHLLPSGTEQRKVSAGTLSTVSGYGQSRTPGKQLPAPNAESRSRSAENSQRSTVPAPATPRLAGEAGLIISRSLASSVELPSCATSIGSSRLPIARATVSRLHIGDKGRVYNLHIEEFHEFFANGILVHNCYAANTFNDDADKPREVQIAEKIRQMQERGLDEHSISINTMRMHMEQREEDAPARLGRVRRPIIRR